MSERAHDTDAIQALLDGRLDAAERARVESHLEACAACRAERAAIEWVKRSAMDAPDVPLPDDLETSVLAKLDEEDARKSGGWFWTSAIAASVAAMIAALVIFSGRADVPAQAAEHFRAVQNGAIVLQMQTSDGPRLERFFSERGIDFETRVFDLAMMSYATSGGRVHEIAGTTSALFAYDGGGGRVVVCQMYEGHVDDLPAGAELRENDEIHFYVYERDGLTMVFWQEGDVTCVMTSDIPAEEVIQLAFAKAIKV